MLVSISMSGAASTRRRQRHAGASNSKAVRGFLGPSRCKRYGWSSFWTEISPHGGCQTDSTRLAPPLHRKRSLRQLRHAQQEAGQWPPSVTGQPPSGRLPQILKAATRHQKRLDVKSSHHAKLIPTNNRTDPRRALKQAKLNKIQRRRDFENVCQRWSNNYNRLVDCAKTCATCSSVKDIPK